MTDVSVVTAWTPEPADEAIKMLLEQLDAAQQYICMNECGWIDGEHTSMCSEIQETLNDVKELLDDCYL